TPSRQLSTRRAKAAPINVIVGQLEDADGAARISQSFVLAHAREAVWGLMADVEKVARCMPGLSLDGPPQGDKVTGRLEAQIGRAGLVRDLVRRIGEAFAQNLDAQLRDPAAAMPQAQLGGVSLLLQVLADRLRALFAHLLRR